MIVLWQPAISIFVAVSIIALQLLRESKTVFPFSTLMDVRLEQPEKGLRLLMRVTFLGMKIVVRLQPEKAYPPIYVTFSGIVTEVRLQPKNA